MQATCELCNILVNEVERIIYQDSFVFITLNNQPLKNGHLMVLPIQHNEQLSELSADESSAFLKAIDLSLEICTKYSQDTPLVLINHWGHRSQSHLHAHIIPTKNTFRKMMSEVENIPIRENVSLEVLVQIANEMKKLITEI